MTIEEFIAIFPRTPFALHYVERGRNGNRKFGWHASFTSSYWTSDTDRPVYNHDPPLDEENKFLEAWAETPEGALTLLASMVASARARRADDLRKLFEEAERHAAELAERIRGGTRLR